MNAKKNQHGGVRSGSGRPATLKDRTSISITLEQRQLDKIDRFAKKYNLGRSAAVRELINMAKFSGEKK